MTNPLIGAWQLLDWQITYSDQRPISEPYGSQASGLIMYSANGWMSVAIHAAERKGFDPAVALRKQAPAALAQAYCSYLHYAGHYELKGDTVYHHVTQSLNPDFVGTVQQRQVDLSGKQLTLSATDSIDNIQRTHTLRWQMTD